MSMINPFTGSMPNVDSLVSQYMALERRPIDTLKQSKSDLTVRQAMFNDLNTSLMALKTKAELLTKTDKESVFGGFTASSTSNDAVGVTASSSAKAASYNIAVSQLADYDTFVSKQMTSSATSLATTFGGVKQTFQLTVGTETKTIEFTPEAGKTNKEVLEALAAVINEAGVKVNASVVSENADNVRLTLTSTTMGSSGRVSLTSLPMSGQGVAGVTSMSKSTPTAGYELKDGVNYRVTFSSYNDVNKTVNMSLYDLSNPDSPLLTRFYWGGQSYGTTLTLPPTGNPNLSLGVGVTLKIDETLRNGDYEFTYRNGSFLGAAGLDMVSDSQLYVSGQANGGHIKTADKLDAKFTLNGLAMTRSSNSISDAIAGVTLNLRQTTTTAASVTIKADIDSAKNKVKDFLNQMNSVLKWLQTKTAVDSTTYVRGPLAGNATYTGLRNTLRYMIMDRVTSITSGDNTLGQIGIGFNEAGEIVIKDEAKFTEKLTANPQVVQSIFANDDGVAKRVFSEVEKFVKDKGILPQAKDGIANQMSSIDKRVKALEETMKRREEQIRSQLTRQLEMMANITAQSNTLSSFMGSYTTGQQY